MYKLVLPIVLLAANVANAGTVYGDKAESATYALRYAGVAPTVAKKVRTFAIADLDCKKTLDREGGLSEFHCTAGKADVKDAAAYGLWTALVNLGFQQKAIADVTIEIKATGGSCSLDAGAAYGKQFSCTSAELPSEVKITPKKLTPKDLVQPVKIEKQ
jgi:hypothetical protein